MKELYLRSNLLAPFGLIADNTRNIGLKTKLKLGRRGSMTKYIGVYYRDVGNRLVWGGDWKWGNYTDPILPCIPGGELLDSINLL